MARGYSPEMTSGMVLRGQQDVGVFHGEVVVCTAEEDKARQEYLLSSDLGYQVQRFGVGVHPQYGEQNFDLMDRTLALELVAESNRLWLELPRVIRDRYQSWANVEAAAASGELEQVLKAAGASTAVVDVPAASPSESAAGEGAKPS